MKNDIKEQSRPEETVVENGPEVKQENVKDKKSGNVKKILLGGVAGLFLGSAATTAKSSLGQEIAEGKVASEAPGTENSSQPYDDKSFSEAFSEARSKLGPGAEFEWHGGRYSTCTEAEWNEMHPSQPVEDVPAESEVDVIAEEAAAGEDEVEILGVETGNADTGDSEVEVEVVSGNDISGEEASFVNLDTEEACADSDSPEVTDAVEDVFIGDAADDVPVI